MPCFVVVLLVLDSATIMQVQDVYDHVLRTADGIDLHRDLLAAVLDVHLSVQSNRLKSSHEGIDDCLDYFDGQFADCRYLWDEF
jgi:hypothetical protein